ncbi:MAG: PadR family transcriptional regulator [Deltaproteobacteria bacterium]|nr:PadR family transcriptional regulator [Deltaproteobacteria bacterium]
MEKLSAVNLWIMGLLISRPLSAYDIAKILETDIIGRLLKASVPAVYKNIKELHKAGYLDVERTRASEMPEKKVYSVTDAGKTYFLRLMDYFSGNLSPHYFEFNTFLANIDKVDKKTAMTMLENLRDQFCTMKTWIVAHEQEALERNVDFAGRAIIKQYRMIMQTLIAWIEEVIEEGRHRDVLSGDGHLP